MGTLSLFQTLTGWQLPFRTCTSLCARFHMCRISMTCCLAQESSRESNTLNLSWGLSLWAFTWSLEDSVRH
ncbi:hypothetical protein DUNSADRAFT_13410 [Dunaliella salina]|uniref:Encoded protein n=1 Tax=Dunaliella salina TaxID=3046 RepID=A0ABQ7H391_DUNSA|nr:hypothetical protein DUNSADRAFT_13410 [Dunaliella salina]|eukprot:KAF5841334.1 hypothetical protein DUNSADRAFT_13410 [Dunaliella salina]